MNRASDAELPGSVIPFRVPLFATSEGVEQRGLTREAAAVVAGESSVASAMGEPPWMDECELVGSSPLGLFLERPKSDFTAA